MGNKKITDLPSATAVNAGDKVEIVQGGTSKQVDANLLSGSGLSGLTTNKVLKAGSATTAVDSNITDSSTTTNSTIDLNNNQIQLLFNNGTQVGYYTVNPGGITSYFTNGSYVGHFIINAGGNNIHHSIKNTFDSPLHEFYNSVTKNGVEVATVNDIPTVLPRKYFATDASKNIVSLPVATYPSLTELSYGKGVTSAIQTQLDGLAPIASPTFTGTPLAPTASANTNNTQIATTAYVDGKSLFRSTTDSLTHTGTLTNTIIWSEDISNKLSSGDIADLISDVVRVSGSTYATIRYYLNSSASLSGATQIGQYVYGFSGLNIADFRRQLIVKSSTVIRVKGSISAPLNDFGVFSNYADVTVNLASLYVIFAITLGNTGDQFLVSSRKMVR